MTNALTIGGIVRGKKSALYWFFLSQYAFPNPKKKNAKNADSSVDTRAI